MSSISQEHPTWDDPAAADYLDQQMGVDGDWFQQKVVRPALDRLLGPVSGRSVLDAGCGNGHLSRHLAGHGALVVGVDRSARLVEQARRHASGPGHPVRYVVRDIVEGLGDLGTFDAVVCNNVLMDVGNLVGFLSNLRGAMSPSGQLVVTMRHPCFSPTTPRGGWRIRTSGGRTVVTGCGLSMLQRKGGAFVGVEFVADQYFVEGPFHRAWGGSTVTSYHRTLSSYFHAFQAAGLRVADIVEPTLQGVDAPTDGVADMVRRIPHFLLWHLRPGTGVGLSGV